MSEKLKDLLLKTLAPRSNKCPVEWIGENARQPDGSRYSWNWAHVMKEVVHSVNDVPETTLVTIPQFAKTSTAMAMMQYFAWADPAQPIMAVTTNDKKIKEMRDLQIINRLEHMPEFKPYIPPPHRLNKNVLNILMSPLVLASGQSTGDAKSTPVKYLFGDECDEWRKYKGSAKNVKTAFSKQSSNVTEENIFDLFSRRTNSYSKKGARKFWYSTPSVKSNYISKSYELGDQSEYYLKCPCCNEFILPEISDFEWEGKLITGEYDDDILRESASIKCIKCEGFITKKNHWSSVKSGKWVAKYPERSSYHRSFRVPAYLTTNFTLYDIVKEYIEAKRKKNMHGFYNAIMAQPYERVGIKREDKDFKRIQTFTNYKVDPNDMIIPTSAEGHIIIACDVQMASIPYVIRYVTKHSSYLIDYGHFIDLEVCRDFIKKARFKNIEGEAYGISYQVIDTGHKAKKPDGVYVHIVKSNKLGITTFGIRGVDPGNVKMTGPISKTMIEYKNKKIIPLYHISDKFFKDKLYNEIIPEASSGKSAWFLPSNLSEDYIKQLTSEQLVVIDDSTNEQGWIKKGKNDLGDCEKYIVAFSDDIHNRI